jgi:hypothetical protein
MPRRCAKIGSIVQGNRDALAIVRVPSEEEERACAHLLLPQYVVRTEWVILHDHI